MNEGELQELLKAKGAEAKAKNEKEAELNRIWEECRTKHEAVMGEMRYFMEATAPVEANDNDEFRREIVVARGVEVPEIGSRVNIQARLETYTSIIKRGETDTHYSQAKAFRVIFSLREEKSTSPQDLKHEKYNPYGKDVWSNSPTPIPEHVFEELESKLEEEVPVAQATLKMLIEAAKDPQLNPKLAVQANQAYAQRVPFAKAS